MNRDIKQHIKLLSTVPEAFIDELFEFYGEETTQTDFVISISRVSKWLRCSKKEILRTLRRMYKQDIDYIVTKKTIQKLHAHNVKEYYITPDCFKRLCMMSKAHNAELVRTYFIEIESLMIKYRTQLIAGIQEDIRQMQKQRKIRQSIDKNQGYTYIIKSSINRKQMYKVGHAKNLINRLRTYQTGKFEDVEVVFVYKTNDFKAVENCVKALANKYRAQKRKEIFELNLDMLKDIIQGCGRLSMKLEHRSRERSQIGGDYYIVLAQEE
jgi:phage anti-repressor protein